jgi:hypothetical protein
MDTEELTRRFGLLEQQLSEGTLHIAEHLSDDFEASLAKVRVDENGVVLPDSLDGQMRATLNAVSYFHDRQEWKEVISLREIQEGYFSRLVHTFNEPYERMLEAGATPYQFAAWYCSDPERVRSSIDVADGFVADILELWDNIAEPTWIHLEDNFSSKAVFTGELFPDGQDNVASSTGVYFDTTVLPDPFVKISPLLAHMDQRERAEEVLRLALQVLCYRSLALADVQPPIVAVLPDRHTSDENYREFIRFQSESDATQHASRLFGRGFSEIDEVSEYLKAFKDSASLVESLQHPEQLVFSTDWEGTLAQHIDRYIAEHPGKLIGNSPGAAVLSQLMGRFAQAHDAMQRSSDLRGTPIIRADTSWLWFNIMLRANVKHLETETLRDLHLSRALQGANTTELSWIGAIPSDALIELRKADALPEIRSILGKGLQDLIAARPTNFYRTGDQVFANLDAAIEEHEQKLRELSSKKWKFAGRDVGSFIVVGGVELAAAITGIPLYGVLAASAGMSGLIPTGKELSDKLKALRADQRSIDNTGLGILLKYREKNA